MKSLVEEALAREGSVPAPRGPAPSARTAFEQSSDVDADLLEILQKLRTNVKIIGCGGGGCNTVDRIAQEGIVGAELYAANTDAQHLLAVRSKHKILLGRRSTVDWERSAPQVGEDAASEAEPELRNALADAHIVSSPPAWAAAQPPAPYVAKLAKDMGALTVASPPCPSEGKATLEGERGGRTGAAAGGGRHRHRHSQRQAS